MFPSSNSTENALESFFRRAVFCDQNPISKHDDLPPIFSNFPSPFFDEHELPLNQMLSHSLQMGGSSFLVSHNPDHPAGRDTATVNVADASESKEKSSETNPSPVLTPVRRRSLGVVPRNRAGKKDRHSKICTAQGVRDRRMRLSLQVARKFFDLQDFLGYDKASKTIEWLFSKSKKAIKELARDHTNEGKNNSASDAKSESFVSECEVLSGIEEDSNTEIKESKVTLPSRYAELIPNQRSGRKSRKTTSKSTLRESRDEARARARCRTREKMMMKKLGILSQWNKPNPSYADIQKLVSSHIPFEEPNSGFQERASSYDGDYHTLPDVGTIENLLGSSSASSISCPDPDLQCPAAASAGFSGRTEINRSILGFIGNWDLLNNEKNQVSLVGNPNSIFVASPVFPFHH